MREATSMKLLLVEDNPGDVDLIKKALVRGKVPNHLTVAEDGVEALAILRKEDKHQSATRPDLILLDLNLPKKDGREVLAEIKADEELRRIPVVILTSSKAEEDVLQAYEMHGSGYITKPSDMKQLTRIVKSIEEFWFNVVRLPAGGLTKSAPVLREECEV